VGGKGVRECNGNGQVDQSKVFSQQGYPLNINLDINNEERTAI
jgi:hypothetical protein